MFRVVNQMLVMRANSLSKIDLDRVLKFLHHFKSVTDIRYRPSKPHRIYCKVNGVVTQIFSGGCIQMLGYHTMEKYNHVFTLLRHYFSNLTSPIIKSCTIELRWNHIGINLQNIPSNAVVFNEREIFPSLSTLHVIDDKLSKPYKVNCSFSSNGKVIVTGAKSIPEAYQFMNNSLNDIIFPHCDLFA